MWPPTPIVANGVVYVESNDTAYAISANNGTELWNYTTVRLVTLFSTVSTVSSMCRAVTSTLYALNASHWG